jgi:exocyst complex component 6
MPYAVERGDDLVSALQQVILLHRICDFTNLTPPQITLTSSDSDYILQLIPVIKEVRNSGRAEELIGALNQLSTGKEAEIESICSSNHQEFVSSVQQLLAVREGTVKLTADILDLNQSIQVSTTNLAEQKKNLVDSRSIRENIDEATNALNACLEVLRLANQVHELLARKRHYAALRALDELRTVHLREISRYKLAEMIEKSVPATQRLIAEAVMNDLNTWLYRIREASQYLGEVAFYHTEMRRSRLKKRIEEDDNLSKFRLNSAMELVADETDEFDILNNEETETQVDFSPLFECMHIHETLGKSDHFRTEYSATRRRQKELLIPTSLDLLDDDEANLSSLLESIAGFAIVERTTMKKTDNFRSAIDVRPCLVLLLQLLTSLG